MRDMKIIYMLASAGELMESKQEMRGALDDFINRHVFSGNGIDGETRLVSANRDGIVLNVDIRHIDENGIYNEKTSHVIRIVPDLYLGYEIKISGQNRHGVKEQLEQAFDCFLNRTISAPNSKNWLEALSDCTISREAELSVCNDSVAAFLGRLSEHMEKVLSRKKDESYSDAMYVIEDFMREYAPSGSGFDNGTEFVKGSAKEIKLSTDFHHLNDNGYYTGWTHHQVKIKPVLSKSKYSMSVSGQNKNQIKDYIEDVFTDFFDQDVTQLKNGQRFNFDTCDWEASGSSPKM